MGIGLATTSTGSLHLEGISWLVVADCIATAGRLDNMRSAEVRAESRV